MDARRRLLPRADWDPRARHAELPSMLPKSNNAVLPQVSSSAAAAAASPLIAVPILETQIGMKCSVSGLQAGPDFATAIDFPDPGTATTTP